MDGFRKELTTRLDSTQDPYERYVLVGCLEKLNSIREDLKKLTAVQNSIQAYYDEVRSDQQSDEVITTFMPYMMLYSLSRSNP